MVVALEDVEVEEAVCRQCGLPVTKAGQVYCSMTCESAFNGHARSPAANGKQMNEVLHSLDEEAAQLCALDGCRKPVTNPRARFCSPAHQRKAGRRRHTSSPKVVTRTQSVQEANVDPRLLSPSPPSSTYTFPGPLEQWAAAAALLPAGWRLEASSAGVVVSWHSGGNHTRVGREAGAERRSATVPRVAHRPLPDVGALPAVRWPEPTDLRAEVMAAALVASPVATREYVAGLNAALDRATSSDELVTELYTAGVSFGQNRAGEAAGLLFSLADTIRADLAEQVAR